jgi:hypothetical protein
MVFEREVIAGEAAEGMHDDDVERRAARRRHVEEPLELRAPVVGTARAGLDEFHRHLPVTGRTVSERLAALIGYRQVIVSLPAGRDAQIKGRAQGRAFGFAVCLQGVRFGILFHRTSSISAFFSVCAGLCGASESAWSFSTVICRRPLSCM